MLLAARTWTHTELPNVTGEETVYGPTGDSNRGPLAYRARTQTTELKSHTHRRPMTISICLIRFIPIYSEPCWNRRDSPFAARNLNMDPHLATKWQRGGKLPIIFTTAEDRTRDPLHAHPNLYCAAIKTGLYRSAVQVCCILNITSYSDIHRGYKPPSVAGSFQICKIWFSSTVRSFRDGLPVYSLTFGDVKRRGHENFDAKHQIRR